MGPNPSSFHTPLHHEPEEVSPHNVLSKTRSISLGRCGFPHILVSRDGIPPYPEITARVIVFRMLGREHQ